MDQHLLQLLDVMSKNVNSNSQLLQKLSISTQPSQSQTTRPPPLPEYNGEADKFDDFAFRAKMALKASNCNPPSSLYAIMAALNGSAVAMAKTLFVKIPDFDNNDDFFKDLRKIFVSPAHIAISRAKFERRIQQPYEKLATYHGLLKSLFMESYESDEIKSDTILIDKFISGLRNPRLRSKMLDLKVIDLHPKSYEECLTRAMGFMAQSETFFNGWEHNKPEPMEIGAMKGKNNDKWCKTCNKLGHEDKDCFRSKTKFSPCKICNKMNHKEEDCYFKDKKVQNTPKKTWNNKICNWCKKKGHLEIDCWSKKNTGNGNGNGNGTKPKTAMKSPN